MDSTNSASNQTSTSADNDDFDDEDDVHSQAHLSSLQTFQPPTASIASSSSIFEAFSPYFTPFPFPPQPPPPEAAVLSLDAGWNSPAAALSPPPQPPFSVPAPAAAAAPSQPPPPRGPRKRARASRRAPTTVINTETSNFRAMVQQFTGFPTPPFAGAPFPARPRLDLFGAAAAGVVPPFLLRPSAHKMIPSPSSSCSSSSSSSASASASASLFDHTIASIARSHLATTIGATPDPSNPIPPKYHDHDKFNLSLFDGNMQRPREASFPSPPFLQPPQPQMAPPPAFPSHSAAMIPRWHVEDQESEQQNSERAGSKFHFRNFHNNQS